MPGKIVVRLTRRAGDRYHIDNITNAITIAAAVPPTFDHTEHKVGDTISEQQAKDLSSLYSVIVRK